MRKGSLTTVETRPKLRTTAEDLGNRNNKGSNMRRETLTRHSTQHDVPITNGKKRGTLILEQLLQHPTTPLKRGGKEARRLENKGEIQTRKSPGETPGEDTTNPVFPPRTQTGRPETFS